MGALDGAELVALGGALDGAELAALIGALDVSVILGAGNDGVQSDLRGSYDLGEGDNTFLSTIDGSDLVALGGALDSADLVAILGSLDSAELAALVGSLDGMDLAALTGALDSAQLAALLGALDMQIQGGNSIDVVQTSWGGIYDLGEGDNVFIGTLDGSELAALTGALDSAELATLIGVLDGYELIALGGALDSADLVALIGSLDVDVTLGGGADQVRSSRQGSYHLGDGANLFVGQLDGVALAELGGVLDTAELAALVGALDGLELAILGGALDRYELVNVIQSLVVQVDGGKDDDRILTSLGGSYDLGDGSDLYIGSLDGVELAALVGSLDSSELAALVGSLDTLELATLGGALDSSDLVALIGSLDASVLAGPGADRVESAFSGSFDLGDGNNVFAGRHSHFDLLALKERLTSAELVTVLGGLYMDVQAGAGNDSARWGLSGSYALGDGIDALSTVIGAAHLGALQQVLDTASLGVLLGALEIEAQMGAGDDFVETGVAGSYDSESGNDRFVVGAQPEVAGFSSTVFLDGGSDNDVYSFLGAHVGSVMLSDAAISGSDNSRDRLDFSALQATRGIQLDLQLTTPQTLVDGSFTLTLGDSQGIEDVIATAGADIIYGNDRPNTLRGAAQLRYEQPATSLRNDERIQWVYLDFDSDQDADEHVYTQEERDFIQAELAATFHGPDASQPRFLVEFTQTVPAVGEYSTLIFNHDIESEYVGQDGTDTFGPGGFAGEIDFRNLNLSTFALIQVNGILGEPGQPADTSVNWIALSAKIAAHELAHTLGLQHQDSFGAIGFGIHNPPGPDGYLPTYPGPVAAFETSRHLLSSPASVGTDRFSDLYGLYFSERSAIKLAFNQRGEVVDEDQAAAREEVFIDGSARSVQVLGELPGLDVPNTLQAGVHANLDFAVAAVDIVGELGQVGERDFYSFEGRAGDLINIEVMSFALTRLNDNNIDPVIRVYDSTGQLLSYYQNDQVAFNDDKFEPPDPSIIDFYLPADGLYIVEVAAFTLAGRADYDQLCGPGGSREGSQACVGDTGAYETFIYRFEAYNGQDAGDQLFGRGGDDQLFGGLGFDILKGDAGNDLLDYGPAGDGDGSQLPVDAGSDLGLNSTAPFYEGGRLLRTGVFQDSSGNDWTATVNYGDGSGTQSLPLDKLSKSFVLDHYYGENGTYTVVVEIANDDGTVGSDSFVIRTTNQSPSLVVVGEQTAEVGRPLQLTDVGLFTDPAFGSETYSFTIQWGDGGTSSGSASIDQPGGPNALTRGSFDASHTYTQAGDYQVTVVLSDGVGQTSKSFEVSVAAAPQPLMCTPPSGSVTHVFAECSGSISEAGQQLEFLLDTSSYTLPRGYAILGFHVEPTNESQFDPAVVVLNGASALGTVLQNANLTAYDGSLLLARVGKGMLSINIGGQGDSTGSFRINVYLAGDVDNSRSINSADALAVRGRIKSKIGQAKYRRQADVDLNGIINSFDYAQTSLGNGVIVISPPQDGALTAGVSPGPAPWSPVRKLTQAELDVVVQQAMESWISTPLNASEIHRLSLAEVQVGELPEGILGLASGLLVTMDADGAGLGWYIDAHSGIVTHNGRMDLLTAVMHELGHVLGYGHEDDEFEFMAELLMPRTEMAAPPTTAIKAEEPDHRAEHSLASHVHHTDLPLRLAAERVRSVVSQLPFESAGLPIANRKLRDQLFADIEDLLEIDTSQWSIHPKRRNS